MKKLMLIPLIYIGVCAGTAFANQPIANQQYVMAAPNPQQTLQHPFDESANNQQTKAAPDASQANPANTNPMNIYVKPHVRQQEVNQDRPPQNSYDENTYNNPQQEQQPAQQNQGTQWHSRPESVQQQDQRPYQSQYRNQPSAQRPMQTDEPTPAPTEVMTRPAATHAIKDSIPNKDNSPYDNIAKTQWFKNCLSAVTTKQLAASAKAFCECGWQKISHGGISANLFSSANPADIKHANVLLQNISQACLIQVVKGQ